ARQAAVAVAEAAAAHPEGVELDLDARPPPAAAGGARARRAAATRGVPTTVLAADEPDRRPQQSDLVDDETAAQQRPRRRAELELVRPDEAPRSERRLVGDVDARRDDAERPIG